MNKKSKRNTSLALLGFITVLAVVVLFLDTDTVFKQDGTTFTIPIPDDLLAFYGQTSLNSNSAITCNVKQHTYGIDSTGITVANIDSKLLSGNPLLSVTTSSGVKMAGYVVEPRIFCQNNFNDDNLSNPDRFTFVIDSSSMIVQVTSTDKNGVKVGTHTASFNTKSASIPIGGSEQSLGSVGIYSTQIEDNLQDGSYATINQFDLRGNLVVYWKGYSGQKYTIPIKFGDISSYHNARIEKGSTGTTTFTGDDKDGDGIKDSYDKCPTQPETYNGYQDGDGCPDTSPTQVSSTTTTSTTTTASPMIYTECLRSGDKTWNFDKDFKTASYCGTFQGGITESGEKIGCGFKEIQTNACVTKLSKIDTTSGCVTLTDNSQICPSNYPPECKGLDMDLCVYNKEKSLGNINFSNDPVSSTTTTTSTTAGSSGKVQWSGEVKYYDGSTGKISATNDPSPFVFNIKLNQLVGGLNTNESKEISQLTLNPILRFDNADTQKKISTTSATAVNYLVSVKIKDSWIVIVPSTPIPDFVPTNGATKADGISLGNIIVKMNTIENKIPATVVGLNDSADVELRVVLSGSIGLNYNDGSTIKPSSLSLGIVSDKNYSSGTPLQSSSGDTSFIWTGLKIQRGTSSNAGGVPDSNVEKCPVGQTGYVLNGILICEEKGITVTDSNNDGVIDESSGGSCAGMTPEQCLAQGKTSGGGVNSSGGLCPLDSGAGDSNGDGKICQICTDSSSVGTGGFPCDQGYRENYCNNTTTCNEKPKTGDKVGGSDVVVNTDSTCKSNLLNLANNACIIQTTGDPQTSAGGQNVCTGECPKTITSDPNMIWYLAGGMILIGTVAIAIKRRK